jgi:hypothetical protein
MANNLETYQGGCSAADQTSGIHVLRYLQRRFAPLDDVDEQVEATKNLEGMTRGDNERMNNFNSRFNAQAQYMVLRHPRFTSGPAPPISPYASTL